MSRIIAIDYGLKRVGIAVTDLEQMIAFPLTTITSQDLIPFLQNYFQKEKVKTIVVGYPGDVDKIAEIVVAIDELCVMLKKIFIDKHIVTVDERYTSKIASFYINKYVSKKSFKRDKKNIDKLSATLILRSYLSLMDGDMKV